MLVYNIIVKVKNNLTKNTKNFLKKIYKFKKLVYNINIKYFKDEFMINKFDMINFSNLQNGKRILDKLYIEYYESNKRNLLVLENDEYEMLINLCENDFSDDELEKLLNSDINNLNDNELAALFFYICAETY